MKKFWLISAIVAALSLAACSSDTESEEDADTGAETEEVEESSDSTEENASEESTEETSLYVIGDEVEVNGAMITVNGAQVVEELEEANRVYEINFTVTNDSEEDMTVTSDNFTLMDLSDEEKDVHGETIEVAVPAGETAEGSLQYVASASTAFKLMGTFGDTEVEWRLPGITALD